VNDQYWGWILSLLGLAGFYVTGKKIWWGWWLNVGAQAVWYAYAIATQQWGFLVMTTMYTFMFTKNALAWTKEHRSENEGWDFNEYTHLQERLGSDMERERVEGEGEEKEHRHQFVVDLHGYNSNKELQERIDAQVQGWLDEVHGGAVGRGVNVYMSDSFLDPRFRTITVEVDK
jgi:hypothetical protein